MKKLKSNDENCLGQIQILFLLSSLLLSVWRPQLISSTTVRVNPPPAHHHHQQQPVVIMRPKVNRSHAKQSYFDRHVSTNINVSRQQFVVTVAMPYNNPQYPQSIHNIFSRTIGHNNRSTGSSHSHKCTDAHRNQGSKTFTDVPVCVSLCVCH